MTYDPVIPATIHPPPAAIAPIHRVARRDPRAIERVSARRAKVERPVVTIVLAVEQRNIMPSGDVRLALGPTLALHLSPSSSERN